MQRISKAVILSCVAGSLACVSCIGGGSGSGPAIDSISVSITPVLVSIPVGTSQQFTAVLSNPAAVVDWETSNFSGAAAGTITQTGLYTAALVPPVYNNNGYPTVQGITQITAFASVKASATRNAGQGSAAQNITVTAPQVTAGFITSTATVALGKTFRFQPYAVGALDTSYSLQVQGAPGGSTTYGTIVQNAQAAGLYTAPAAMPMSGRTVTVTVISNADPSKTANATVTLQ